MKQKSSLAFQLQLVLSKALSSQAPKAETLSKAHVEGHTRIVNGKTVFVHAYDTRDGGHNGSFLPPDGGQVHVNGQTHNAWLGKQADLRAATVPEHEDSPLLNDSHVNDFIRRSGWTRYRNYGGMHSYVLRDDPASWKAVQDHYDQHGQGERAHLTVLKDRHITPIDDDDDWDHHFTEAMHKPTEHGGQLLQRTHREAQRLARMSKSLPGQSIYDFRGLDYALLLQYYPGVVGQLLGRSEHIGLLEKGVTLKGRAGLHLDAAHHRWMRNVPLPARGAWSSKRDQLVSSFNQAANAQELHAATKGRFSTHHLEAKRRKGEAARALAMHLLGTKTTRNAKTGKHEYDAFASVKANSLGGRYTPQRAQLHEKIIRHFLDAHTKNNPFARFDDHLSQGAPQAVFMSGGSGSGKGFVKKKRFGHHPSFVNIDPDEIKEHLAHADGLPGMHSYLPEHWHEESSDIAKKLADRAHREGRSYIFDGVGGNAKSLISKMERARAHGYRVHARRVHVDRDGAWKQNLLRERSVSRPIFDAAHDGVARAWEAIATHAKRHQGTAKVLDNRREVRGKFS